MCIRDRIGTTAESHGASHTSATYALWAIAMLGGMVPNIAYAVYRCSKNRSWSVFAESPRTDVPLAVLMGVLFMGSTVVYGLGAVRLGVLGTSVGWAIMQIMQIMVGNAGGWLTGEWELPAEKAKRWMLAGIGILIFASLQMAFGNYLEQARRG